jgi:hypothetical protein
MLLLDIVRLVVFLSIPQYLLLAIFLFTNKKGKPFANKILGIYFLVQTLSFLNTFARLHCDIIISFVPDFLFVFSGIIFLWTPLMYYDSTETDLYLWKNFSSNSTDPIKIFFPSTGKIISRYGLIIIIP